MSSTPETGRLHPVRGLLNIVEPRVADRLVPEEGEFIVDEVHHHWVVYVPRLLEGLLALGLLVLAAVVPIKLALVVIAVALAVLTRAAAKALASFVDRFVITNLRVFRSWGLLSQQLATMPIQRILDIAVYKPVVGRILGYGHFVFESAAKDQGLRNIRFVPRPFDRDLTMQRVIQRTGLRRPMEGGLGDDDVEPDLEEDGEPAPVVVPVIAEDTGPYGRRRGPAPAPPPLPRFRPPSP